MHLPAINNLAPLTPSSTTEGYPWRMILAALAIVLLLSIAGSWLIDQAWGEFHYTNDARFAAFRGVCYWVGDARTLNRISLNGYTDYFYDLSRHHLTDLPDRSWWPMFPVLNAGMIALTGDGVCSGWKVNLLAVLLLVPVIQALTGTRRLSLLVGLMLIPFSLWLYVGMAEGVFLLFSGLLWLICLQAGPGMRHRNIAAGTGALLMGALVGLTKPNSIALMPGFAVMGLITAWQYLTALPQPNTARWREIVNDANPGWAGILAVVGIALGNGLWFWQTSGYYPFYVLLAQRTLWFKQFYAGDLWTMLDYFSGGLEQTLQGELDILGQERLMRLSAPIMIGILALQQLPPRLAGRPARPVPVYARFSLAAILALMFFSGQIHAITRYAMGNIFVVILYLRYVYGDGDEPPIHRLLGIILRREAGAFQAALRLVMLALGPLCTIIVMVIGPQLGI
jgi:hypothetical protein